MLKVTTLRSTLIKVSTKMVKYRSYKNFNKTVFFFFHELNQTLIRRDLYRSDDPYLKLTEIFSLILSSILDKHAPIKSKQIRENQVSFMN